MKKARFGKTLPVRLSHDVDHRLKLIALSAGITKSDALRLAVKSGLPALEAGKLKLSPSHNP